MRRIRYRFALDSIEGEVLEVDVIGGAGLSREEGLAHALELGARHLGARAQDGDATEREGLVMAADRLGQKDRRLRLRVQVPRVLGELGEKKEGTSLAIGRHGHERPVGKAPGVARDGR